MMNNSLSGQQGNSLSLIDGEQSRVIFENLDQAVVGQPIFGTFIPNQSGGFLRYRFMNRSKYKSNSIGSTSVILNK